MLHTDLGVLVTMAKKDYDEPTKRRFAPFWKVYLKGNPLADAAKAQIEELKKMGGRIFVE